MAEARLYDYWRSSASYRLRIALSLAGIEYETIPVDLVAGEQNSPVHLARNPQGLIPVLEIDGQSFTQSLAILDYLDETRGLGLLPFDPAEKAKVRALAQAIAVDLHPVCNLRVVAHAEAIAAGRDAGDIRKGWMQHFIPAGLAAFEAMLADFEQAPFCAGDRPGLADICLMPQIYNARRWEVPVDGFNRIGGIVEACQAHPAFIAAHPDRARVL